MSEVKIEDQRLLLEYSYYCVRFCVYVISATSDIVMVAFYYCNIRWCNFNFIIAFLGKWTRMFSFNRH